MRLNLLATCDLTRGIQNELPKESFELSLILASDSSYSGGVETGWDTIPDPLHYCSPDCSLTRTETDFVEVRIQVKQPAVPFLSNFGRDPGI